MIIFLFLTSSCRDSNYCLSSFLNEFVAIIRCAIRAIGLDSKDNTHAVLLAKPLLAKLVSDVRYFKGKFTLLNLNMPFH